MVKIDAGSDALSAALKNIFCGGLDDLGHRRHHLDDPPVLELCRHRAGRGPSFDGW